jgi:hypothetical protein
MRLRHVLFFLSCTLILVSCSQKVDPTVAYEGSYRSYVKVLKEWTRTENVYQPSFDTIMTVTATWNSEVFQDAFVKEKSRAEKLLPDDIDNLERKIKEERERVVSFVLAFYTPKFKWNKLDESYSSWKLWLVDVNGTQVAPLAIERFEKIQIMHTKYYPYYDQWSYMYEVRFPREDAKGKPLKLKGGTVKFLVSGVFGSSELVWEVP